MCDVIGIEEKEDFHLICLDAKGQHKDYYFPLKDSGLEALFNPIPVQTVNRKPDSSGPFYYFYFVRFKEDGNYDVEFDSRVCFPSGAKCSSTPFDEALSVISPTLVDFLVETAVKESLKGWNNEFTIIDRQTYQDKRIEWWTHGSFNYGIITDMVKNQSDTLVWNRIGKDRKKDFTVTLYGDKMITPADQWFFHSGSSSIISTDPNDEKRVENKPLISISFRRKRLFSKEKIKSEPIQHY